MGRSSLLGFRLIESIVLIGIVLFIIGLFIPAVRRVREPAARAKCSNNLKQLALAFHNYESYSRLVPLPPTGLPIAILKECLPMGCFGPGNKPEERLSWMVALLPYVEQDTVFKRIDIGKGYEGNLPATQTAIPAFLCPETWKSRPSDAVSYYIAMAGIGSDAAERPAGAPGNGFLGYYRTISIAAIPDGSSNTIALMETRSGLGPWARGGTSNLRGFDPEDLPIFGDDRPFGGHRIVAMADGSVRTAPASISPKTLAAAITIAGGEVYIFDD